MGRLKLVTTLGAGILLRERDTYKFLSVRQFTSRAPETGKRIHRKRNRARIVEEPFSVCLDPWKVDRPWGPLRPQGTWVFVSMGSNKLVVLERGNKIYFWHCPLRVRYL